jgi:hypothetical protein
MARASDHTMDQASKPALTRVRPTFAARWRIGEAMRRFSARRLVIGLSAEKSQLNSPVNVLFAWGMIRR